MEEIQTKNTHFVLEDRIKIEAYLEESHSAHYIARKLGRPQSSISDEIKRNKVKGVYVAKKAQAKANDRRRKASHQIFRIATSILLRNYVEEKLKRFWSPEGISGRLRKIDTHLPYVGKDAIYTYVDSVYGRNLEKYLWNAGKKKKGSNYTKVTQLKDRDFIDQRPKSIDNRLYFGDWEADFIVSGRKGKGALLVFVERKSRYVLLFKLADRKVVTINEILNTLCGAQLVINSLTIDNDICFRHHKEMSRIMKAPIYFCHPYHSWEKGAVEKMNQLIRRFIPKGANISKVSIKKIVYVQNILNGKSLECLGYHTPEEVISGQGDFKVFMDNIKTTPCLVLS